MSFIRNCLVMLIWAIGMSMVSGQFHKDYVFDHITIQDGLSHNSITVLQQDKYGYIWIGTRNGLNKYDGHKFVVYNSEKPCSGPCFRGKSIDCLMEDSKGNLWVGTREHGINVRFFDTDRFVNIDSFPGIGTIEGYDVVELYEDSKGNIWIGVLNLGLIRYNPANEDYKLFTSENSGLLRNMVFEVLEDEDGDIYVKTAGYGLHVLHDNDQFEEIHVDLYENPNMDGYRATMKIEGDFLWIGMEGTGLYKMNLQNRHFAHFTDLTQPLQLSNTSILDLLITRDGKFFVATDGGGLGVFNERRQKIDFLKSNDKNEYGLNSNAIQCLMEDKSGNIWVGTFNGGLNVIKKDRPRFEKFNPVTSEPKLSSVLSIMQSVDKTIWIGTDGNGMRSYNEAKAESAIFRNDPKVASIRGDVIKSIFESKGGEIWSGTFSRGVNIYDRSTNGITSIYGKDLEYQNIWSIEEDRNGKIWLGTMGDGIYIVDNGDIVEHHKTSGSYPNSPSSNDIMIIYKDHKDRIWVGTRNKGLNLWNEEEKEFIHYVHNSEDPQSISDDEIRSIFQDSKDRIWIGTEGGGLNLYKEDGTFEHFGVDEGLIADNILAIEEDNLGNLWMSSFTGISRFTIETNEILNYSFRSKNQNNQFNQESILKGDDGRIYFGGINGIDVIDPSKIAKAESSSKLIFSELKIFDQVVQVGESINERIYLEKPIEEADEIRLYHKDKAFTLSLSTNDFLSFEEEPIQYMLEGFDDSWKNVSEGKHSISYTNLDNGRYTLHTKYKDAKASIDINVVAPYWNTWWFRIIASLLIFGVMFYLLRLIHFRRLDAEKKKLLEKEKELLETKNVSLEENINVSNSKLLSSTAQMAHKNEILQDIKQELNELQKDPSKNIQTVIRKVDFELKNEDYWKEFNIYFEKVDKKFTDEILRIHPELTQNDLKICTFIRLNMNTKDIASLLNISVRGVEKGRYRLKKRLELTAEQDLIQYVRSIHPNEVKT